MKFKTSVETLKHIIDLATIIEEDVVIEAKKNKMEIRSFAVNRGAMLRISIDALKLDEYESKEFKVFFEAKKIKEFMRILNLKDKMYFTYIDDKKSIKLKHLSAYRNIRIMDLRDSIIPEKMPTPPFDLNWNILSSEFIKLIKLSKLEGNYFTMKYEQDSKNINQLEGISYNKEAGIKFTVDQKSKLICPKVKSKIECSYDISYFESIINLLPDTMDIKLHSQSEKFPTFPMSLEFDLKEEVGKAEYMIAPVGKEKD